MSRDAGPLLHFTRLVLIAAMTAPSAMAQFGASLQGTVSDKTGAVISGATVTVTDQGTGISRNAVTSDAGVYRISGLSPGVYRVDVEAASFKESNSNIDVGAESTRGLNVVLTPGPAQESVTVTSGAPALETENANVSGGIAAQQVEALPSFGRDPYELLRLAPGVFGDAARGSDARSSFLPNVTGVGGSGNSLYQTENQPQISANGQRVTENNFTIDGVDVNSLTNGGAAVVTPTEESISEIRVLSGSYSAEDGSANQSNLEDRYRSLSRQRFSEI